MAVWYYRHFPVTMNNQQVEIGVLMVSRSFFWTRNININSNTSTCVFGFSLNKAQKLHQLPPPLAPCWSKFHPLTVPTPRVDIDTHLQWLLIPSSGKGVVCTNQDTKIGTSILVETVLPGPFWTTRPYGGRAPSWNWHQVSTWEWMVGIKVCFWDCLFSGAMLALGSVITMSRTSDFFCISCLSWVSEKNNK